MDFLSVVVVSICAVCIGASSPEELVNPLMGTDSVYTFSNGNLFPVTALPHGFNHWTIQTRGNAADGGWFFKQSDRVAYGIRCSHQPSPWINDYGNFLITPQVGESLTATADSYSPYNRTGASFHPYYMAVDMMRYQTKMELAPTMHAAILRLTFPAAVPHAPFEQTRRVIVTVPYDDMNTVKMDHQQGVITAEIHPTVGLGIFNYFALYFHMEVTGANGAKPYYGTVQSQTNSAKTFTAWFDFTPTADTRVITIKVGTSFISLQQAKWNMEHEISNSSLMQVASKAQMRWRSLLSRVDLHGQTDDHAKIFYTCLFKSLLFPRRIDEIDMKTLKRVHASPYAETSEPQPGPLVTDQGFWDGFRTTYPLLGLLYPDLLGPILEGWLNAYKEGGWLPKWASPGYRESMVGTFADVVLADAIFKGVPGFNYTLAYEAMRKDAFEAPPTNANGAKGRVAFTEYLKQGYIGIEDTSGAVARTLDFVFADWATYSVAAHLNRTADAMKLAERKNWYQNVYDSSTGLMRGKFANGSFWEPFDQFEWGGPYVEGGAWQYGWSVPWDPKGLAALHGGADKLAEKMLNIFKLPRKWRVGSYGQEIHEMTEMALANGGIFGQYDQGNQPGHHILYMFTALGPKYAHITQKWTRLVLQHLYTINDYPGDEDNGEMSSWFVLSSLGLYCLAPGDISPHYIVTMPLFPKTTLHFEQTRTSLDITVSNFSLSKPYITKATVDGYPLEGGKITHASVITGGTLAFSAGDAPAL
eukprot:TRINITY_DN94855_c0_g1_i1.p1 TRINITY_DN94855_c0_g1~~TRINITY_DN94855_c0_g1_i1.p1  ORF type:complete len:757 (-),score=54.42 TRINITY_DN94855_c0_g1_i1:49-2319(-)